MGKGYVIYGDNDKECSNRVALFARYCFKGFGRRVTVVGITRTTEKVATIVDVCGSHLAGIDKLAKRINDGGR